MTAKRGWHSPTCQPLGAFDMWREIVSRVAQGMSRLALSKNEHFVVMAASRLDYVAAKLHEVICASPEGRVLKSLQCELEYCAFLIWMFKVHAGAEILARRYSFDDIAVSFLKKHLEHTRADTGIRAVEQVMAQQTPEVLRRVKDYQRLFASDRNQETGFDAALAHFAKLYCGRMPSDSDRNLFWFGHSDIFRTTFEKILPAELAAIQR